ncbi:hypothetical protein HDF26_004526 [Pedobacter cryoconitis]|uniref:Uncharacterized protein n=1 Tax=Pedobacter cryoconitis TaxID=188932 RepID=A0A7W8ZKA1_9SPHI|nr:hypothetical protein [Pedobacter cryoconitis]MBB5635338.1 hypothetical protein [Pedobacter cryoconitis]MBB6274053.1 hypothetical protein [Pedobacter cryoconitis]
MQTRAIDYSDVVELLQHKIITYIRLNPSLNKHVQYKKRFVDNTLEAITFNFHEFSDPYRAAHIDPDFEDYCIKFIDKIVKPVLVDFIKEVKYGGYGFYVLIRYKGEKFEKRFTILNKTEDE